MSFLTRALRVIKQRESELCNAFSWYTLEYLTNHMYFLSVYTRLSYFKRCIRLVFMPIQKTIDRWKSVFKEF